MSTLAGLVERGLVAADWAEALAPVEDRIAAMGRFLREEIAAGRTDAEVRADLVARYGDFVLFKPPVRIGTWLLWFGPFIALLLVGAVLLVVGRRRKADVEPLSSVEEARLADILANGDLRRSHDAKPSDD